MNTGIVERGQPGGPGLNGLKGERGSSLPGAPGFSGVKGLKGDIGEEIIYIINSSVNTVRKICHLARQLQEHNKIWLH